MRQDDRRDSHDPPARPHGPAPRVAVPPHVCAAVAERCGSPVVGAASQHAGFTPGFASVLTCEDGSRHFVKAASVKAQRRLPTPTARRPASSARFPAGAPAPWLLWTHEDDWVVLGLEYVERQPQRPWRVEDPDACLDMLTAMAEALTPAPQELRLDDVATELAAWPSYRDHMRSTYPDLAHRQEAALAARFAEITGGTTVVHTDVRDDNFLLTGDGRVLLCDWNWPARGAAWLDTVFFLIGPRGDGLDGDAALARSPHRRGAGRARRHRAGAGGGLLLPPCRPAGAVLLALGARGPALAGRSRLDQLCERRGWGVSRRSRSAFRRVAPHRFFGACGPSSRFGSLSAPLLILLLACLAPAPLHAGRRHHRVSAVPHTYDEGAVWNIKSQIKRNKQNEKRHERNKAVKTGLKSAVRKFRELAAAGDTDAAVKAGRDASRKLDKAASKGVIHKNQAANRKSAIAKTTASL